MLGSPRTSSPVGLEGNISYTLLRHLSDCCGHASFSGHRDPVISGGLEPGLCCPSRKVSFATKHTSIREEATVSM